MSSQDESDFFDLLATVSQIIAREKLVLVATIVLGAAIGAAIGLLSTPVYRSSVLVAVSQDSSSGSFLSPELAGVASLVGLGRGTQQNTEESIALLNSRQLMFRFVDENELLPVLFHERWDKNTGSWQDAETEPTALEAFDRFTIQVVTVNRDVRSGLITLSIDWHEPDVAAKWANDLIKLANEMNRSVAINDARNQLEFVNTELGKTNELPTRTVLYKIVEEQITKIAVASTREEFAFKVIDPAVPADVNRPLKPKKLMLLITSAFIGLFFGLFLVLVRLLISKTSVTAT